MSFHDGEWVLPGDHEECGGKLAPLPDRDGYVCVLCKAEVPYDVAWDYADEMAVAARWVPARSAGQQMMKDVNSNFKAMYSRPMENLLPWAIR